MRSTCSGGRGRIRRSQQVGSCGLSLWLSPVVVALFWFLVLSMFRRSLLVDDCLEKVHDVNWIGNMERDRRHAVRVNMALDILPILKADILKDVPVPSMGDSGKPPLDRRTS